MYTLTSTSLYLHPLITIRENLFLFMITYYHPWESLWLFMGTFFIFENHVFVKIYKCVNTIILNVSFIIKTQWWYFVGFACSKFMLFALNSSHFMSHYFFVKQSVFKFIKLSCNIHSFCRIRFFTINIFYGIHLWL